MIRIVDEMIKELEELNKRRKMQGFKELKRINRYVVRKAINKVFNENVDLVMGLRSCGNIGPGGRKCVEIPPKSADWIQ